MAAARYEALGAYARERMCSQLAVSGSASEAIEEAKRFLDPNALTLGFARRFTAYKRLNLLLHNPERLIRLLSNAERPMQLILAGKAHPADRPGHDLIQQWIRFCQRPEMRSRVIFLTDYDMQLAERLVQGIDVWLNTPQRPWEACGTSGMKVLVNGGINFSELDGWWAEACNPKVGWALGDGREHGDDPSWDATEANALYDRLEHEIIPEFYDRDKQGMPSGWIGRVRESMAQLAPRFSASRAVRDYTEQHYLPAAQAFRHRAANRGAAGVALINWQRNVEQKWAALCFGEVKMETRGEQHVCEVQLRLNDLDPSSVQVEIYADGTNSGAPVKQSMTCAGPIAGMSGFFLYRAVVPSSRPITDYTARVMPHSEGISIPLENTKILWQR